MKDKKQLTKAETQVMNVLWSLPEGKGFSADIMGAYPEPKPALTTLLTFLKILKEKDFVRSEEAGKAQLFSAAVSREEYTRQYMTEVKNTFFGGSLASLVSFFAKHEQLSDGEVEGTQHQARKNALSQTKEKHANLNPFICTQLISDCFLLRDC